MVLEPMTVKFEMGPLGDTVTGRPLDPNDVIFEKLVVGTGEGIGEITIVDVIVVELSELLVASLGKGVPLG